jgi:hypothetical protein
MYSKSFVVFAAATVLLAGAALARDYDRRDSGLSVRQMQLDREYARKNPTITPGTPPALSGPRGAYGHVAPHRPSTKRR